MIDQFIGADYIRYEQLRDDEILLILLSCQELFLTIAEHGPELHNWNRVQHVSLAAVFAALIIVRLPALTGPANLSQDATEYIDIARNVAGGEGLTLKVRAYFFGDGFGVPYPAESLRSPLFPLLMGGFYAVIPSRAVFRWFNFGLFLINMALLASVLRRVLPPWIAIYSVLLAGMSEPMFLTSIFPWAEQTALLWLLLVVLSASMELHVRWGAAGAVIEGFLMLARVPEQAGVFARRHFLFCLASGKEVPQGGGRRLCCRVLVPLDDSLGGEPALLRKDVSPRRLPFS